MLMRQHTDKIREKFILKSNTAMQSASIALCQSNHRVPVLVDPSGTAFQWLRTWLPKSSFASVLNKDIHSILRFVRDAMQEGRTIVLHDVEDIHLIPEPERARVEDSSLISLLKSLLEKEIVTQSELQFFKTKLAMVRSGTLTIHFESLFCVPMQTPNSLAKQLRAVRVCNLILRKRSCVVCFVNLQ